MENKEVISQEKSKVPFYQRRWFFIVVGVFLFLLWVGNLGDNKTPQNNSVVNSTKTQVQTPAQTVVFDVPKLVGKNLNQVMAELGTPQQNTEPPEAAKPGVKEWDKQYTKDGKSLLVTYNFKTKEVIDLFITTDKTDKEGFTKDKQHLLSIGNLKENDSNYTVEFVKALKNPSAFTGVKVISKKYGK